MKALIIVASILIPLVILLFSRLRFSLVYDGSLGLRIRYLFLRFRLYPRREKPKKNRRRKNNKTAKKATAPAENEQKKKTPKKKPRRRLRFSDIRFLLRVLGDAASAILEKARRHVRLEIRRLRLAIAGEPDPARAAIEYGLAVQSAEYLFAYLESTGFFSRRKNNDVNISVDFLSDEHSFDARIDISCPLVFLFPLLFSSLTTALRARRRWTRHRKHTQMQTQDKKNLPEKEQDNG